MSNPFEMFSTAITASEERERAEAEQRAAARAAEAQKKLDRFLESFVNKFVTAVVNFGVSTNNRTDKAHYSASQLKDAQSYCEFLVSTEEVTVPQNLNAYVVTTINDKFAYGAAMAGDRLPEGHFLGQRQDWFLDTLTKAKESMDRSKSQATRPRDVAGIAERENPEDCANPVIPGPLAAKLAESITPKAPKKTAAKKTASRHLASAS